MHPRLAALFRPVSADHLARFRILFGLLMAWQAWDYLAKGWVKSYFIDPPFHFTYYGFGWVKPLPGNGMTLLFIALGVLGLMIAAGWAYRLSSALFAVGFTYVFLLDRAVYLNHWYLIAILAFLMTLARTPILGASVPAWNAWLLRGQVMLVYFYAAIAKIDGDWLGGAQMSEFLAAAADKPIIGALAVVPWMPIAFSWAGFAFDLLVGPALLWRLTRPFALVASGMFHLMNALMFPIGVFPWLMLAITFTIMLPDRPAPEAAPPPLLHRRAVLAFLSIWTAVQILVPLRHFLYPGNASWTNEGHRFSWRMMLLAKRSEAVFHAVDPRTGASRRVPIERLLTPKQHRSMIDRPDMMLEFAHYLADRLEERTGVRPIVRVDATSSLNRRPRQRLIDPDADLASEPRSLKPASWIVPLAE